MTTRERFERFARDGTTTDEALALHDDLGVVTLEEMKGRWKGAGFHTQHPMDGILEAYRWYGKEFIDDERVHPLIFEGANGSTFYVDPSKMPLGLATRFRVPRGAAAVKMFQATSLLLRTTEPKARMRMCEYRGKVTGTMIYDDIPVLDIFRKVDASTMLGVMDLRGVDRPFFFLLRRE